MKNAKGQVLIELAFILPILLLLVFGIIDLGRAMLVKNTLNHAARSAARAHSVIPNLTGTSVPTAAVLEIYQRNGIPSTVAYELKILGPSGNINMGTAQSGDQVQVKLSWPDFKMLFPLYQILATITGVPSQKAGTLSLGGEASMRYE